MCVYYTAGILVLFLPENVISFWQDFPELKARENLVFFFVFVACSTFVVEKITMLAKQTIHFGSFYKGHMLLLYETI